MFVHNRHSPRNGSSPAILRRVCWAVSLALAIFGWASSAGAANPTTTADYRAVAQEIDRRLEAHWQTRNIKPAATADDATLARRLTLDLAGRIPTRPEWEGYLSLGDSSDKRFEQLARNLLDGPEFALQFGSVLDELLQGPQAGNAEFVDYLRRRMRERKPWDALFRELLLGPWDADDAKPATRFLDQRTKDLDRLTTDATRAFFGVDISCARCHDHPLVTDWKQDHYYGMASFFNRTSGGKGSISEKYEGDVTFKTRDGAQRTAALMFLSGRVLPEPPAAEAKKAKFSRREQLVNLALEERTFLSRAVVNRVWHYFLGRGLVNPVDQLHSGNPPSIPGLLEWLADDFANFGYDLHRLVGGIVTSRAYRLSSRWEGAAPVPDEGDFAVSRLRHLSPRQYALSVWVATLRADFAPASASAARAEKIAGVAGVDRIRQYLAAEQAIAPLLSSLDPATDGQSSAAEALFISNHPAVQAALKAEAGTLAARLAETSDDRKLVETAIRHAFCRPPEKLEIDRLAAWIGEQPPQDRTQTCEQLVWSLLSSAEFRFRH